MSKPERRRIMRRLSINEISGVDVPAQSGALAAIVKRDKAKVEKRKALAESFTKYYDCYVDENKGPLSFASVMSEVADRKKKSEAMEEAWPLVSALDTSIRSIIRDPKLGTDVKRSMLATSVNEFLTEVESIWPEVEEALEKALAKAVTKETDTMAKDAKKASVKDSIAKLRERVAKEDAAEVVDEILTELEALAGKYETMSEEVKGMASERSKAKAQKELDPDETAFMEALDEEDKDAFLAMSKDERASKLQAFKEMTAEEETADEDKEPKDEDDETMKIGDKTVKKSAVGTEFYKMFQDQQKKIDEIAKAAEVERTRRETVEFTKRVEDDFFHLPGTIESKVEVLRAVSKMDDSARKSLETMLKAGESAIVKAFEVLGSKGTVNEKGDLVVEKAAGGRNDFQKAVDKLRTDNPKLSRSEAMRKARLDNPGLYESYNGR